MSEFVRVTEQPSPYRHLEKMPILEIITSINNEDKTVAYAIEKKLPEIEKLIHRLFELRSKKDRAWSSVQLPTSSDGDPQNAAEEFLDLFRKYAPLVLGWLDPKSRTQVRGIGSLIWADNVAVDPLDVALMLAEIPEGQTLQAFCVQLNDPEDPADDCLDRVQKRIAALNKKPPA